MRMRPAFTLLAVLAALGAAGALVALGAARSGAELAQARARALRSEACAAAQALAFERAAALVRRAETGFSVSPMAWGEARGQVWAFPESARIDVNQAAPAILAAALVEAGLNRLKAEEAVTAFVEARPFLAPELARDAAGEAAQALEAILPALTVYGAARPAASAAPPGLRQLIDRASQAGSLGESEPAPSTEAAFALLVEARGPRGGACNLEMIVRPTETGEIAVLARRPRRRAEIALITGEARP